MHATKALLTAAQILQLNEKEHIHQHNNNAIRLTRSLSEPTGIKSIGVHLVRVQQGRDSTEFHSHQQDEEFIYILSGQGIASIGEDQFQVSGGDLWALRKIRLRMPCLTPTAKTWFISWEVVAAKSIFATIPD